MEKLVLVADDYLDAAGVMADVVRGVCGEKAVVALDGVEALSLCRLLRPEVAILDIDMPGLTGVQVAQALTRALRDERPYLIGISGRPLDEAGRACFDAFMGKPFDIDTLARLIASVPAATRPPPAEAVDLRCPGCARAGHVRIDPASAAIGGRSVVRGALVRRLERAEPGYPGVAFVCEGCRADMMLMRPESVG